MEWHEILAWVVIVAAFIVSAVWSIKRILCPKSRCACCDKDCPLKNLSNK